MPTETPASAPTSFVEMPREGQHCGLSGADCGTYLPRLVR
jgi:hypothetical protein